MVNWTQLMVAWTMFSLGCELLWLLLYVGLKVPMSTERSALTMHGLVLLNAVVGTPLWGFISLLLCHRHWRPGRKWIAGTLMVWAVMVLGLATLHV